MTGDADRPGVGTSAEAKLDPGSFALRVRPPKALRFRRGLIISLVAMAITAVAGLTAWALRPDHRRASGSDATVQTVDHIGPDDVLSNAPASYSDIPKLPDPNTVNAAGTSAPEGVPPTDRTGDAARIAASQRQAAERTTALASPVLAQLGQNATPQPAEALSAGRADPPLSSSAPAAGADIDPTRDPNETQRKSDLANLSHDRDVNDYSLVPRPSPWLVSAGNIIAASLITGIDSDLPGDVVAQVTQNVYDSPTGHILLIPQGARLIGKTDNVVSYGQRRALVIWQRILWPDGSSLKIDNLPAADASGFTGLTDSVDSHGWALIKGIALSTLLGVGSELSSGGRDSNLVRALRETTQGDVDRAGQQITSKNLNVQPTIRIRPGWPVRVVLHQDLVLKPWQPRL